MRRALFWLKANNRYYADININHPNLANLPADGNVYQDIVNSQNDSFHLDPQPAGQQTQEFSDTPIMRRGVADLATIDQRLLIQDILGFELC